MKGGSFLLRQSGGNSIPDGSGAPSWYASSTSSVCNKTQSAWPESWTVFCIEIAVISVSVFLEYASRHFSVVTILQTGRLGRWRGRWIPVSTQISTCRKLYFLDCCKCTSGRGVALLNLPPLDTAILVKLARSQQQVKGYWIWIQSQSTALSVWAQADVQCLLRDAHRIVRSISIVGWSALEPK